MYTVVYSLQEVVASWQRPDLLIHERRNLCQLKTIIEFKNVSKVLRQQHQSSQRHQLWVGRRQILHPSRCIWFGEINYPKHYCRFTGCDDRRYHARQCSYQWYSNQQTRRTYSSFQSYALFPHRWANVKLRKRSLATNHQLAQEPQERNQTPL